MGLVLIKMFQLIKRLSKKNYYIARRAYFKVYFLFFKLLFLLTKRTSKLTCYSGTDGGGAQLQRIISVASLCHYLGIEFIFTPMNQIDLVPENTSKILWLGSWNSLINFQTTYKTNYDYQLYIKGLTRTLIGLLRNNSLYALNNAHLFADSYPDNYDDLITLKGLNILKLESYYEQDEKPIRSAIVHYRVPTTPVSHSLHELEKERQVSVNTLINSVERIKRDNNLKNEGISVILFNREKLSPLFLDRYPEIHLDDYTNAIDAVRIMAHADILVVSYSSMSYLAGLFSQNIIYYYKDFWHSPKKEWRSID